MKRASKAREEVDEADDQAFEQPSSPGTTDVMPPSGDAFMFSAFRWSDGKTGVSVKAWVEPRANETIEQASNRAIRLGVLKMREAEEALAKG